MKRKSLLLLSLLGLALPAQPPARPDEPQYTADGQLKLPANYREWIFLSAGLGMTYGFVDSAVNTVAGDRFDNVFVTPQAYKAFLATGTWPDKTMFIMEVRTSSTKGSINKGGHFQQELAGLEAHVKDQSRFPTRWEFFGFSATARTGKPQGANSSCHACHSAHGAVDDTFVQFYPTLLPVARAKGTLKSAPGK